MADATYSTVNTPNASGFGTRIKFALGRAFKRIVQAREMEARRQIGHYLSNVDDKTLSELGYDRKEVARWV